MTYQTIAFLDGQPPLTDEMRLLLGLYILNEHVFEKPGGIRAHARIIMPDAQMIETTEWPMDGHEKRIDAVSLQDGS
jgi:hypothetical protein